MLDDKIIDIYRRLVNDSIGKVDPTYHKLMVDHLDAWQAWTTHVNKTRRLLNNTFIFILFLPYIIYRGIEENKLRKRLEETTRAISGYETKS